jgi:transposase
LAQRANIVRLASMGVKQEEIARMILVTPRSVRHWVGRFRREGVAGLFDRPRSGRPPTVKPKHRKELVQIVATPPQDLRVPVTSWTVPVLAEYLCLHWGFCLSERYVRKLLNREGFVYRRPKLDLEHRQDPKAVENMGRYLRGLQTLAVRPGADFVLLYGDEAEFHLNPPLTKMWMKRGCQFRVPSAGQNRKVPIFGAFNYANGRVRHLVGQRKNSAGFIAFLVMLLRAYPTKIIRLVLDGASIHDSKKVREFLRGVRSRLRIVWLPAYTPELNLIERVWGHVKRSAASNYFFGTIRRLTNAVSHALSHLNRSKERLFNLVFRTGTNLVPAT